MSQIEIPFRNDMAQLSLTGRKIATSRNKKYGERGDIFQIEDEWFVLVSVSLHWLDTVAKFYYEDEGFNSPEAFIKCWKELHPRLGWTPDKKVWFHEFVKVRTGEQLVFESILEKGIAVQLGDRVGDVIDRLIGPPKKKGGMR